MQNEQFEIIAQVFTDVLEKMAFMFPDLVDKDELPPLETQAVQVQMVFRGCASGSLLMAVLPSMCTTTAANVLGMDEDDEFVTERAVDALKEVLNVCCGQIFTALVGEEPMFDLSVPEASFIDREAWQDLLDDRNALGFLVEGSPVLLKFVTDGEVGG